MAPPTFKLPSSYNDLNLPTIKLSHHPPTSSTPTPIIIISLHRPSSRNAFTDSMATSLIHAFTTLSSDPRVRCIVLTSSDPSNAFFCPGMDLTAEQEHARGPDRDLHRDSGGAVSLAIHHCSKPVVAAINGSAVGVGITMTLAANVRVVSKSAKIGFVFGRRGFNMEGCSSFYLPRLVGMSRALHLTSTGAVYPANHKLLDNLFSEVVPADEVLSTAIGIAEDIASNVSQVASRVMKDMMFRGPSSPEEAHLLESKVFYDLSQGRDAKEGIDSFLQKRNPDFRGTLDEDAPSVFPWWTAKDVVVKSKI